MLTERRSCELRSACRTRAATSRGFLRYDLFVLHAGKPKARRNLCLRPVEPYAVIRDSKSEFRRVVLTADLTFFALYVSQHLPGSPQSKHPAKLAYLRTRFPQATKCHDGGSPSEVSKPLIFVLLLILSGHLFKRRPGPAKNPGNLATSSMVCSPTETETVVWCETGSGRNPISFIECNGGWDCIHAVRLARLDD